MKNPSLILFLFLYLALPCLAQTTKAEEVNKEIKDNFIELKGGNYPLGDDNIPITLAPFAISPIETTYGQMEAFALANGKNPKKFHEPKWGEPDRDMPAVYISWFNAIRYADWLSAKVGLDSPYTIYGDNDNLLKPADSAYWNDKSWLKIELDIHKKGYRLPTEAEWEYAASGYEVLGRKQKYAGTDQIDSLKYYAWSKYNSGDKTHKTASLQPNVLGLYDMTGNIGEWCFDEYYSEEKDVIDTFKNKSNPFWKSLKKPCDTGRSLRGGRWFSSITGCMVLNRYGSYAGYYSNNGGFRLARTL